MTGDFQGNFSVIILIMYRKPRSFYRNIASLGPSHCPGTVFCGDLYHSGTDIFLFVIIFVDLHSPDFYVFLCKPFGCLQRQVCSYSVIIQHLFSLRTSFNICYCLLRSYNNLLYLFLAFFMEICIDKEDYLR